MSMVVFGVLPAVLGLQAGRMVTATPNEQQPPPPGRKLFEVPIDMSWLEPLAWVGIALAIMLFFLILHMCPVPLCGLERVCRGRKSSFSSPVTVSGPTDRAAGPTDGLQREPTLWSNVRNASRRLFRRLWVRNSPKSPAAAPRPPRLMYVPLV